MDSNQFCQRSIFCLRHISIKYERVKSKKKTLAITAVALPSELPQNKLENGNRTRDTRSISFLRHLSISLRSNIRIENERCQAEDLHPFLYCYKTLALLVTKYLNPTTSLNFYFSSKNFIKAVLQCRTTLPYNSIAFISAAAFLPSSIA